MTMPSAWIGGEVRRQLLEGNVVVHIAAAAVDLLRGLDLTLRGINLFWWWRQFLLVGFLTSAQHFRGKADPFLRGLQLVGSLRAGGRQRQDDIMEFLERQPFAIQLSDERVDLVVQPILLGRNQG
jgi:hypothetical protein